LILGMGTVFSFLLLLVGSMGVMERVLRPWAGSSDAEEADDSREWEHIAVAIAVAHAGKEQGHE